jgi:hypothetical protein
MKPKLEFAYFLILIAPFCVFLSTILLSSSNCIRSYLCYGYPEFLRHSVYYDFFLLRADYTNGVLVSHWSSELLIAVFPFIVLGITKKIDFAFTATFFYATQHEMLWFFTNLCYGYGFGWFTWKSFAWFIGYAIIAIYVLRQYRNVFLTRAYLYSILVYFVYLTIQWWYWVSKGFNPSTDIGFQFDETGTISWLVWTILILILVWVKRKKCQI